MLVRRQLAFFLETAYMCERLPAHVLCDYDAKQHQKQITECLSHFAEAADKSCESFFSTY